MHVPDGFFDTPTCVAAAVTSAGVLAAGLKKAAADLDGRVAMAGITAAFIFAAQMVNYPVASGTSGHLLGGALAAVLLGRWVGSLAVAAVLVIQGAVFADGGLSALGINVLLIAIVPAFVGWAVFTRARSALPATPAGVGLASGIAAMVSVPVAATAFSALFAIGGAVDLSFGAVLSAMANVHVLIGVGEGLATALLVAVVVSPFASGSPDGLERVAHDQGFAAAADDHRLAASPLADYAVDGVESERVSTGLAGLIGVVVTLGLAASAFALVRRLQPHEATT